MSSVNCDLNPPLPPRSTHAQRAQHARSSQALRELKDFMISSATGHSLLNYLTAQTGQSAGSGSGSAAAATTDARSKASLAATAQAALAAASGSHKASVAAHALDKQQTALSKELRTAMSQAGVKLTGPVDFSLGSDGVLTVSGSAADEAATASFLKADTRKPSLASRLTSMVQDAGELSATIQQRAAISQAARYGASSGGVMSLYASLMQQSNATPAVMTFSAASSALTYPGVLATDA